MDTLGIINKIVDLLVVLVTIHKWINVLLIKNKNDYICAIVNS